MANLTNQIYDCNDSQSINTKCNGANLRQKKVLQMINHQQDSSLLLVTL